MSTLETVALVVVVLELLWIVLQNHRMSLIRSDAGRLLLERAMMEQQIEHANRLVLLYQR